MLLMIFFGYLFWWLALIYLAGCVILHLGRKAGFFKRERDGN